MVVVQHILKVGQDVWPQVDVLAMIETMLEGMSWIVDVQLGIHWSLSF